MSFQMILDIAAPDDETFDSFVVGGNDQLVTELKQVLPKPNGDIFYLFSENAIGCSHLLHALVTKASEYDMPALMLPLKQQQLMPEMLQGLESIPLICIDDLQLVCGNKSWEFALFDLINRVKEHQSSTLVFCADKAINTLPIELPDLASRLSWGTSYSLAPLSEEEKVQAIIYRAEHRGMQMTEEVVNYLLSRSQRDLKSLLQQLDKLDAASMQQQRKITIPFVKQELGL